MSQDFKVTTFDATYSQRLATGDTILGGSSGSNTSLIGGNFLTKDNGEADTIKAHGNMGSTETFDPADGNVHSGTLNANCTFTLTAPTGSGFCTLEFWLTQDSTGGRTVTWPGSVTEQGTPDTTLSTTSRVIVESIDGGTSWIATWVGGGTTGSSSSLPWFIVTDAAYGATGDGTTDDTAAVNLAIAALNTATRGVLYFPAGTYKCTSALTAITASGTLLGDGGGDPVAGSAANATLIKCTSATATFLTIPAYFNISHVTLYNTATASAGYGIGGTGLYENQFEAVAVGGFWINWQLDGGSWKMTRSYSRQPRKYGAKITYAAIPDGGDWFMDSCYFVDGANSSDAAIRIESAGGGKITNCKINSSTSAGFATGIDVAISSGNGTSILLVSNTSIENIRTGDAIRITTSGTGYFGNVAITGCQVALYSNNAGRAVKIAAASTGGQFVNGGIGIVMIDGCDFVTSGTARAAIELTNTDRVTMGDIQLYGFNARYTSSGDTNTTDGGGVSFATPAIVLGTAAATGAASTVIRSDSTIVAFDATSPTTQALGDSAATGSAAVAARRDHKHAMPALSSATPLVESGAGSVGTALPSSREDHVHPAASSGTASYLVIASTHSTPLAFDDIVQSTAGDDFIYST